jgi:polyhydroxyalkanoate synthesis regulator phasin
MDLFKRAFLAGVGALSLSREKAKAMIDELVANGQLKEKEGRAMLDDLAEKAEAARKDVEKNVKSQVQGAYKKMNLASLDQVKKMERRLQELEKALAQKAWQARSGAKKSGR